MSGKPISESLREFLTKERKVNIWRHSTSTSREALELKARLGDGDDVEIFLGYRASWKGRFSDTKLGKLMRRMFR